MINNKNMNNQNIAIRAALDTLIDCKAKKLKDSLRIEYGSEFLRLTDAEFIKLTEKENEETGSEVEYYFKKILKEHGKEKFMELYNECKEYTDAEFLEDIQNSFGESWHNFLKSELKRNAKHS